MMDDLEDLSPHLALEYRLRSHHQEVNQIPAAIILKIRNAVWDYC